jgi:hypothetical protein
VNVFRVSTHILAIAAVGYQLRTLSRHRAQEFFRAFIDKRDVIKVHDARTSFAGPGRRPPDSVQLANPGAKDSALQHPSRFRRGFSDGDFQHVFPSRVPSEPTAYRLSERWNYDRLRNIDGPIGR